MEIRNQHASILLFAKAEMLSQQYHNTWRCIYIRMSNGHEKRNIELRKNFVIDAIDNVLANHDGTIFLCDDGDIAILFQGAARPILNKLAMHFGPGVYEENPNRADDITFTIFDLSRDWDHFYTLCEVKYLQALANSEDARPHPIFNRRPNTRPTAQA